MGRRVSLSRKFSLTVALLFLSFVLSFIAFQYVRERGYKVNLLDERLQGCNNDIAAFLHGRGESASLADELRGFISEYESPDIRITIIDTTGKVLFDNDVNDTEAMSSHIGRPEIQDALRHGKGRAIKRVSEPLDRNFFYSATYFPDQHLIIRTSLPYSVSLTRMLQSDMGFLWLGVILIIILLYIFFIYLKRLDTSITQLRSFADMAKTGGDIMNAAITFPDDDLGEISDTIVRLYANLQNSEDDKTRLKRQLTQNIAHELKTPVSSIQGYLETLVSHPDISVEQRGQFLDRCYAQSVRLGNLIADITLLSKIEETSQRFEIEEVDILALVDGIHKDVALQLEEKGMKMLVLINPGTRLAGNQQLLYSIFRNLTDNAIAYAGENTTITVQGYKEDENFYYFDFSDNGCGVAEEHIPHLFERFYRVDKGRSRKSGGTGLGLAIVKNAVLLHGGRISIQLSKTGGLEFKFSLGKHPGSGKD